MMIVKPIPEQAAATSTLGNVDPTWSRLQAAFTNRLTSLSFCNISVWNRTARVKYHDLNQSTMVKHTFVLLCDHDLPVLLHSWISKQLQLIFATHSESC